MQRCPRHRRHRSLSVIAAPALHSRPRLTPRFQPVRRSSSSATPRTAGWRTSSSAAATPGTQRATSIARSRITPQPWHSIRTAPLAYNTRGNAYYKLDNYDAAIADYSAALKIIPNNDGVLINRGNAYHQQGKYNSAIADYSDAIKIDPRSHLALVNRGNSNRRKGDLEHARQDFEAAARIKPDYARAYSRLGQLLQNANRYREAKEQYQKAIAVLQARGVPADIALADAFSDLGFIESNMGDTRAAAAAWERTLAIHEQIEGKDHPNVAAALALLASAYSFSERYGDAQAALQRALAIAEAKQDLATLASVHFSLAILHGKQRSYAKAQLSFEQALAVYEKQVPVDEVAVGKALSGLSAVHWLAGRYLEAAQTAERAIVVLERSAPNSTSLATAMEALAVAYHGLEREAEAEGLLRRVIAINEAVVGPDNMISTSPLHILGDVYRSQGKYREASETYERVLKIREKAGAADTFDDAQTLHNLGDAYRGQGKPKEAERLYRKALAIRERTMPSSSAVAWSLIGLAQLYSGQDRYAEALELLKRALAIDEKALGPQHPDLAYLLDDLAIASRSMKNYVSALDYSRRATASLISFAAEQPTSTRGATGYGGEIGQRSGYFLRHLINIASVAEQDPGSRGKLGEEAFEIAQLANFSSTAAAVHQLSSRFAADDDSLASLVRSKQDYEVSWRERERALSKAVSDPAYSAQAPAVVAIRQEMAVLESNLARTENEIERGFPAYAALARPKPLRVEEIQKLLGDQDALVFYVIGKGSTFIFSLTRERFAWKKVWLGDEDLTREVAAFRQGLEVDAIDRLFEEVPEHRASKLFNLGQAHKLYEELLSPVAEAIEGKQHLIVVPSGPLTALPFHLLVTDKPGDEVPDRLSGYRNAAWLAKRHAVSILPSVGSLKTLSQRPREAAPRKPFVAFGDPVFGRNQLMAAADETVSRGLTRGYASVWQGSGIDRTELSRLPRLPETADEIRSVGHQLGASEGDIYLQQAATEHAVKSIPLSSFRVVYFATHGLIAGEIEGLGEPALALTLPDAATADDDGLLTASEVARLNLNADWVVLSACNTFAGEKPGAEALSGLARAFFYAGARALMVSHWPLDSSAAAVLTTSTFKHLEGGIPHSEAMRRAMFEFMLDPKDPRRAYPAFWAPFVVVGRE